MNKKKTTIPDSSNPLSNFGLKGEKGAKDKPKEKDKKASKDIQSEKDFQSFQDIQDAQASHNRVKYAFNINEHLLEQVRDISFWERVTMADIFDMALADVIDKFQKHNGGPYDKRTAKLKTGRPPK